MRPVGCEFYDHHDISAILGIGRNTAYEVLNELEARGWVIRAGKRKLVRRILFYQYLAEQDGHMPHEYRTADKEVKKGKFSVMDGGRRNNGP